MINLIDSTDSSSTYEFSHEDCSKLVTYRRAYDAEENPDFEALANEDYAKWLEWLNVEQ